MVGKDGGGDVKDKTGFAPADQKKSLWAKQGSDRSINRGKMQIVRL